jgi:hypothetical protein
VRGVRGVTGVDIIDLPSRTPFMSYCMYNNATEDVSQFILDLFTFINSPNP